MSQNATSPLLLILPFVAFAIFFPLFWGFVSFTIAALGGWRGLASRYGIERESLPVQLAFTVGSARIGWANYNNVFKIARDVECLYLDVIWVFRPGHQCLRIPVQNISAPVDRSFLFWNRRGFSVDGTEVTLSGHLARWLQQQGI